MNTSHPPDRSPLALIAGPTASGKSALATRLAQMVNGTVINADASQVYKDIPVLSAQPSEEERHIVPHRLFGHVDGKDACSVADWASAARAAITETERQNRIPILAGGTGLYIRMLLYGIAPIPPIDPDIRAEVRALPVEQARAALLGEDPAAAGRINPGDRTRIARALEVVRSTGQPLDHWQRHSAGGIADSVRIVPVVLLPPRDWLRARCDARFDAMLARGAADEVAALVARRLDPALPVMRAIGVPEIAAWLSGAIDRETMAERAKAATRQYAKRQYTWLRHQLPMEWPRHESQFDADDMDGSVIKLRDIILTR